jgi:hypothetical protein
VILSLLVFFSTGLYAIKNGTATRAGVQGSQVYSPEISVVAAHNQVFEPLNNPAPGESISSGVHNSKWKA